MHKDLKELLFIFNAHGVKYLVVGAYAVSFHSQPRATKDLDLFIQADSDNAKAVYEALATFGAPLEGMKVEDFSDKTGFFRMGREPLMVDILTQIDGVDFDEAWERHITAIIDEETGLKANFISGPDLITSKIAAGRPQDLADASALRKTIKQKSE